MTSMSKTGSSVLVAAVLLAGWASSLFLFADPIAAQAAAAAGAREMRHFWHVFIAYAIAWALVFGWLVSIVKRLRKVEERIDR